MKPMRDIVGLMEDDRATVAAGVKIFINRETPRCGYQAWLDQHASYAIQPDDIIVPVHFRRKEWESHADIPVKGIGASISGAQDAEELRAPARKVAPWPPTGS